MLVRERWMLCLTWLLGWGGLEEGALGAGGTGRFLVSFSSVGVEEGFRHDVEADTWLDRGWGSDFFFGIMYVVLVTIRAPVSWCLWTEVDGDCVPGNGLDFAGLDAIKVLDSTDCCLDTPLLIGSLVFSWDWLCGGTASVVGREEGASSVEASSVDCFEGVTSSTSASTCLLLVTAVRGKIAGYFMNVRNIPNQQ